MVGLALKRLTARWPLKARRPSDHPSGLSRWIPKISASVKKTSRPRDGLECWPFAGIGSEKRYAGDASTLSNLVDAAKPVRLHGLDFPLPYSANLKNSRVPQPEWFVTRVQETDLSGGTHRGDKF